MTAHPGGTGPIKQLGRYALHEVIASGGMASVHYGRLLGPVGFSRTVAIKRLHERLARDPDFTSMFLDEARLAARVRHPNVVSTLDVVATDDELFLVMEYVQGESLSRLNARVRELETRIPIPILTTILTGALHGLHAAHEATSEDGSPLALIHRDVSPQNIIVGVDGTARVLDFGVAKAAGRATTTREGELKGKLAYMAPEQLQGLSIGRAIDVYASGVVLWEGLVGRRLFIADSEGALVTMVLEGKILPPSTFAPEVSPELDAIVLKAVARDAAHRWANAREMARALEKAIPSVTPSEVGEWVEHVAAPALAVRAQRIRLIENSSSWQVTAISESGERPIDSGVEVVGSIPDATLTQRTPELATASGTGGDGRETFVGRSDDLTRMKALFERMQSGRPAVARVHGPSGIGKSAILREFLRGVSSLSTASAPTASARGTSSVVLAGRCYEQEDVPFKALASVVDALGRYLATLSRSPRLATTSDRRCSTSSRPRSWAPDGAERRRRRWCARAVCGAARPPTRSVGGPSSNISEQGSSRPAWKRCGP